MALLALLRRLYNVLGSSILHVYGHPFFLVHSYYVIRFPTKFDEYRTSFTSSISGTFFSLRANLF